MGEVPANLGRNGLSGQPGFLLRRRSLHLQLPGAITLLAKSVLFALYLVDDWRKLLQRSAVHLAPPILARIDGRCELHPVQVHRYEVRNGAEQRADDASSWRGHRQQLHRFRNPELMEAKAE